ncbi:MAG TPA: glutathione transferase GstA [Kofleriaceae bacterium]|nr:glutathione transferase GstA [Kofleriaceae bacterium]
MKLYYSPGASSLAAHVALREAGQEFELDRVDLKANRTAAGQDYLLINEKGSVPALDVDGKLWTESPVVLQIIADLAPARGLAPPNATVDRYRVQEWLAFLARLDKTYEPLFVPDTPPVTAVRARAEIAQQLEYLERVMVDRGYLDGETFSVADCYLFVMLRWCERFEIDRQVWPNLDAYYLKVQDRPGVQAALAAEGVLETHRFRRTG